jgi:hypothetical protein
MCRLQILLVCLVFVVYIASRQEDCLMFMNVYKLQVTTRHALRVFHTT